MAVREHGMVQFTRGQHLALDDSKVVVDVGVTRLRDEDGMAFGVDARFVDPRVQGRVIDVVDLLVGGHMMIQLDGIGTTSAKGVPWVERWYELQGVHMHLDVGVGLFKLGPLAFPHFDHIVPFLAKGGHFGLGLFVGVSHGAVEETQMFFMAYGIALGTPMPETAVKFIDGVGLGMKAVHGEGGPRNAILARVAYVLQMGTVGRMRMIGIGASHVVVVFQVFGGELSQSLLAKLTIAPGQPFEGHSGLIDVVAPSADGFTGQTVGDHAIHAEISIASGGDGHVFKGVEPSLGFKHPFESHAALFEETHIRFAVVHQFFLEVKDHLVVGLFLVPGFELLPSFGGHGFGHVVVDGGDGSHVLLMFGDVEFVGEVPLFQFRESKGFGKRGQWHLEETERIDETDLVVLDF